MNLTDLREELAEQADQMDSRHSDLLGGARRHARRTRAIRTTTAAATVAVIAFGSALVVPNLLPAEETTFDVLAAATPTPEPPRVPIRGVARDGQRVKLADGLFFTLQGKTWRLENTEPCSGCTKPDVRRATIQPPTFGRQGVHVGWRPGGLFTMDLVQGKASRVNYSVRLPSGIAVIYAADVYQLPSQPGWTLAYVEYLNSPAIDRAWEDKKLDITVHAYDASGKVLPQTPPK